MSINNLRNGQGFTPRHSRLNRFVPNSEIAFERTMRIRILPSLRAIFLTALAGSAASSQAGTVVSNLGESLDSFPVSTSTGWVAASFTTDAQTYTLNSISLSLSTPDPGVVALPTLFSDGGGTPTGVALEIFIGQTVTAYSTYTFASAGLTLNPNTTYWISLAGNSPVDWLHFTGSGSTSQTGDWTIGDTLLRSTDSGSTWPTSYALSGRFSVDATPVPEPSSVLLLGIGAIAGLTFLRQSARRRA